MPTDPVGALPPLRDIIADHGLAARRALGQHFLLDLNLTRRIARAAGPLDSYTVLEIGPGPGGLTRALLLEGARRVVAVERDSRCVAALASLVAAARGRLTLVEADALGVDEVALIDPPALVVANLPYNISTVLILKWLERPPLFDRFVLMLQKEVAERLAAPPGGKTYGRLSVMVQWRCRVRSLFDVPARAFTPPPKVTSSVVELVPRAEPLAPAPADVLSQVVAAAFGQRRKMLRRSLRQVSADPDALLTGTGIAPTARAEELSVEAFCALARAVAAGRSDH